MEPSIKDVDKVEFLEFIQGYTQITIPAFQRPYTWKPKQLTELWDSIISNSNFYYIGTIFGIPGNSKSLDSSIEIIDGQQRIMTLSLLVLALQNYLQKNKSRIDNSQELIEDIAPLLIHKPKFRANDREPRTKIHFWKENLNDFYQRLVFENVTPSELDDNQKRIFSNYKKAQTLIKDYFKESEEKFEEDFQILIDKIRTLYIIVIVAKDDVNAFQLFEGLNSTGIPLSEVDLIKNAILKRVYQLAEKGNKKMIGVAEGLWNTMESDFEENSITWFSKYLRHHWISTNGYVGASDLFAEVKSKELSEEKSLDEIIYYLKTLTSESSLYNSLRTANEERLKNEEYLSQLKRSRADLVKIVFRIKMYGVQQVYEVLLALCRKFHTDENYTEAKLKLDFSRLANFSLLAKYTSVVPSQYEKLFAEMCLLANEKSSQKDPFVKIFRQLRPHVQDREEEFASSFSDEVKYRENSQMRRFLYDTLYQIYEYEHPSNQKLKFEKDSVEHIIAQKFDSNTSINADLKNAIHKIGNLAILDTETNGRMGNLDLEKKAAFFEKDAFESNRDIAKMKAEFVSDPVNAIDQRGKRLGRILYNVAINELNKG